MRAPSKDSTVKTKLRDDEIKTERTLGRRTLLSLIAGATGAGVASCAPTGTSGRGFITPQPTSTYTGVTDADTGQFQDQPGYGRYGGTTSYTGYNDNDLGQYQDQPGYGRYGGGTPSYSGLTDNDGGPYQDKAGYGSGSTGSNYTGVTDSDSGSYQDQPYYGRRGF